MELSHRRCLIVDDSATFCAAARSMLEAAGMTVVGAVSTLADAVSATLARDPDLVLVDIDLAGESGFDVVEALHALGTAGRPAIVVVSTHDQEDFAELIAAGPAVGFVQKFDLTAERLAEVLHDPSQV